MEKKDAVKNKNINDEKSEQKILIRTKQSWHWNYVYEHLNMLFRCHPVMDDEEFHKRFDSLYELVAEKISTPYEGDIKNIYVIVEQEAIDDDQEKWLENNRVELLPVAVDKK
ncbi:MAG: hypothetical protein K2J89_02390 [Clostridia bacterium]|nr:hypothetical protein [Clostridia bacterium]